ncbi:hypothetical protein [Rubrobacter calidifluminis]|uniref:hypothetical protein n=1 Tax=Rubrobacter calidifluminis TaxID=1392640 RepID=UPI00235FB236|nr:hypothetical protein [Rubrobacter calidifluminis]
MEGEHGTVDDFARRYPGMWLAVVLDGPGSRSGTLILATPSREEAGRAVMRYAAERRPVYFGRAPEREGGPGGATGPRLG